MREFDAFGEYPGIQRTADRTIRNRIAASYRDKEFYDGDRSNGYGGMKNDGRWGPVAENLIKVYGLNEDSLVLQIGCHKGFLLGELFKRGINVRGTETSEYAIGEASYPLKPFIKLAPFTQLPFRDHEFDLVVCASAVYTLTLGDGIKCLKEILRVGRDKFFITLGAYETPEEFWKLRGWYVLASTVLTKSEWLEVLNHVGYDGDYRFDTVQSLNLS